jgi:hypothetical protein
VARVSQAAPGKAAAGKASAPTAGAKGAGASPKPGTVKPGPTTKPAAAPPKNGAPPTTQGAKPPTGVKPPTMPPAANGAGQPMPVKPAVPAPMAPTPPAKPAFPVTVFQTNSEYDPRIDLRTDLVAVHKHGAPWEEIDRTIQSWKGAGYPVHRMFFIGSDAGNVYTRGQADGTPHPGDVEMDSTGDPIRIGERPYMVPTAGWLAFLKENIRRAIDSGAEGIWPEEPLLHAAGGYSPAFKAAWEAQLKTPWVPPHESPVSFFRASRVKAELYLRAVEELARYTKEYAKEKGREVKFYLPVHSPISYANSNLIFPHAAAARLPIDGMVAQVWSGPARFPVTYEGKSEPQLFESSWMHFSYFGNLLDGIRDRTLYFLADPVEDDPRFTWPEYERWYKSVVAASVLAPRADGFEVMPWPDRIYLPSRIAQGTPAPPGYLTEILNLTNALKDLPAAGAPEWSGGTRGIGVVVLDSLMWQRGGPQGSSMRSLHGLVLPLLKRGIPVESVPGERAGDAAYLSKFKVLLLSYDMQKPLDPEVHRGLAAWVRAGGVLVVFGGEDPYTRIGEWWNAQGYPSPIDHLLKECGAQVDLTGRAPRNTGGRFREVLRAEGRPRAGENRQTITLPLGPYVTEGKPVHVRFSDLYPEDGWGAAVGRVRVLEGSRVRADFRAGSVAERPFLVEDFGSGGDASYRFADRESSFSYRFNRLGPDARLEIELRNQYRVEVAGGDDPAVALQTAAPTDASGRTVSPASLSVSSTYPVVVYPLAGAEPVYRIKGEEAAPIWWSKPAGGDRGGVLYCGLPSAFGADSAAGGELVRRLARLACEKAGIAYAEGPLVVKRGPYVVGYSLGRTVELRGYYVDLFHPELPLLENPRLPLREPGFYKEVLLISRIPTLLHCTHRVTVLEGSVAQTRLRLSGPRDTAGVVRIFPAGMSLAGVDARDPSGASVAVETHIEGRTVRIRYPQAPSGIYLNVKWIRPEARLTE